MSTPAPVPRVRDRGADLLVALLRAHGVAQVMGVTGGAIMETMDALQAEASLQLRILQTEMGAAWAAMGYARTTGKVGVCVVTSGPAATNVVTPLADAQRDHVPLLVITGQVPTFARHTDAFQETNITEIAAPVVKKAFYLYRVEDIAEAVCEAFRLAQAGRPGPVLIDFTKDAQQAPASWPAPALPCPLHGEAGKPEGSSLAPVLDEVIAQLQQAKRPVVLAGYGVVLAGAQPLLEQFLRLVPCPLVHTLPGKAAVPTAHPCNYGMLGMHGFYVANWLVHHADLILSFGARFDDRITGDPKQFAPHARQLIHFDIDPAQIRKVLPERKLAVVGHLRHTLAALCQRLQGSKLDFAAWHAEAAAVAQAHPSTYVRRPGQLQVQHVLEVLNTVVEQHTAQSGQPVVYTTEVGDHQMWAAQYLRLAPGWQFLTSSGQGAMGSGLPMAIGAQLACPEALVICLAGDGSLRFSEAELETISEYGLPVKVLAVNNEGYGIVRMWNHRFYQGRETGVIKRRKDWTLLARSSGFAHVDRLTAPGAVPAVLTRMVAHREPHFVELVTPYEECLPLMPPGKTFHDIIEAP